MKPANDYGFVSFLGFAGAFVGGLLGAILLSALQYGYYLLFEPATLKDAQWGMVFLNTVPQGFLFGTVVGLVAGVSFGLKGEKE